LLKAVQSRPTTGHPRPGLYAALMNGYIDPARFPMSYRASSDHRPAF
jgi:starvation-inducible outer membrane lipoprotein